MIIRTNGGAYYLTGLFAKAHKNLDIFNSNIYFSYLMVRSLMDEIDAQQFHKEAVALGDEDILREAEKDLAHIERSFQKACLLMTHFDGIDT